MDMNDLGPILARYGISVCGGWFSGLLLDGDIEREKHRIHAQMDFFIAAKAPCIVYGETARSIQGVRSAPLSTKPKLTEDEIKAYGAKMTAFAEWCAEQGMPISYHHHMAAAIETEPEVDLFMANTGEALPLLYDAGHMAFAGGDVMRVIDKHHKRISHVHTKDVRMNVIARLDRTKESFLDAVVEGRLHRARRRLARLRRHRAALRLLRLRRLVRRRGRAGPEAQPAARDGEEGPQRTHARHGARRIRGREMNSLKGKIAVISGGTQGLGAAIAHTFAEAGAAGLVIVGRGVEKGHAVAKAITKKTAVPVEMVAADLGRIEDVHTIIRAADKRFGRVDILVNAAGLTDRGNMLNTTPELFDRMLAVNTRAPFFLIQEAAKVMIREGIEGRIVNIGSASGLAGQPFLAPYSVSKGALATLTRHAGFALMRNRIHVNQLDIGWMNSDNERALVLSETGDPDFIDRAAALKPFGRILDPKEVARAVLWMASDDGGMMTGAVIPFDQSVYGGYDDAPTPAKRLEP